MSDLDEPKNALVKQYKKMFKIDGVDLEFEDSAISYVAGKAIELDIGARGLRSVLEHSMFEIRYYIPQMKEVARCIINKDALIGNSLPILLNKPETQIYIKKSA